MTSALAVKGRILKRDRAVKLRKNKSEILVLLNTFALKPFLVEPSPEN